MPPAADESVPSTPAVTLLGIQSPVEFRAAVCRAAALLRAGDIVAVPTETVYGLAADARNPAAVARIFAAKGRPAHNPIIVHVASLDMARSCVRAWPEEAGRLARAFWPGPLTLVLPKAMAIPEIVTAGGPTVGVRWPSHPFMQALIRECGFPLAAPSANPANQLSPTTALHVRNGLGTAVLLIVDGGPCQVGIESTVLDLAADPPRVLRPGMISETTLRSVLRRSFGLTTPREDEAQAGTRVLASPGLLPRHYAPRAKLLVLTWEDTAALRTAVDRAGARPGGVFVVAHTHIPLAAGFGSVSVIPHDAEAFARALYAELHRCDQAGAEWIVVEAVPDDPAWAAIADRLRRAAR